MEATKMSINRGLDKENVIHIDNGILCGHKKEWNNAMYNNMNGFRNDHTKWGKSGKAREISYMITIMWNLIKMITEGLRETDSKILKPNLWLPNEETWQCFGFWPFW